jgi:2-methylcitrate dehydratase PrpD
MMTSATPTPWSEWLVAALRRPIGLHDRQRAALQLIDWMACAHLGQTTELGDVLRRWAAKQTPGPIWVCGHSGLQAAEAARWNGSLGSSHEMDDVHREAVVHPGDTVIPAALAMAQRQNASPEALLDAVVVGYETAILLGLLSGPAHYAQWYSTATTGVFASGMACARLLKLDTVQTQHALALAGMQSAGVWQCRLEPGLAKQMATGHSAQAGLVAADMAAAGMTGPLSILEGPLGWLKATGGGLDAARAQALLQAPPDRAWRVHEVSFKPWPACRHVHPAIECALKLHAQGIDPGQIEHMRLVTYAVALSFADQPCPQTPLQGKFSLQHGVAWALSHGDFGLEATAPEALVDPICSALRKRMSLACGPAQEQAYPQSFGAQLQLQMANGTQHSSEVINVLGDPENPLSPDQVMAKAMQLLQASGWVLAQAEQLIGLVQALPQAKALGPLWDSLQTGYQSQNASSEQASESKRSS